MITKRLLINSLIGCGWFLLILSSGGCRWLFPPPAEMARCSQYPYKAYIPEEAAAFRRLTPEAQVEAYLCALLLEHPPSLASLSIMVEQRADAVVALKNRLIRTKDAFDQDALLYALIAMTINAKPGEVPVAVWADVLEAAQNAIEDENLGENRAARRAFDDLRVRILRLTRGLDSASDPPARE